MLHCISAEAADIDALKQAYTTIRTELAAYDATLAEKPEVVLLTKTDLLDAAGIKTRLAALKKIAPHALHVFGLNIYDDASLKAFSDFMTQYLEKGKR